MSPELKTDSESAFVDIGNIAVNGDGETIGTGLGRNPGTERGGKLTSNLIISTGKI